ncbi:MAG TPA: DUF1585 domain-containing protein [Kofleriaceae bacterium]|nr:DUF1585 domain-containing protein [Kofleriaceae bacterium]
MPRVQITVRRSIAALCLLALAAVARDGAADRELADYRYFRALSVDLLGRPPTAGELAALDKPDFDLNAWIDTHLAGPAYASRLASIYLDALRLEVGPSFQFVPNPLVLRRETVLGPDGAPIYVYFRRGQRRVDPATDGDFCLTHDETGLSFPPNAPSLGFPIAVSQEVLDAKTTLVKPWWLYGDYRAALPSDRISKDWSTRFPSFVPVPQLLVEPDGKTPTTAVRVCKEEAQTADTGNVYVSGRPAPKKGEPPPAGRLTQPPGDSGFAKATKGRAVSCLSGTGFQSSVQCGCGIGLERCMPASGPQFESAAFQLPTHTPLGLAFDASPQPASTWEKLWWSEEAKRFLLKIIVDDRDFREVLTSRATEVNGPLAQFYRFLAGATCCGPAADAGYAQPEGVVDPGAVPAALVPEDTATWLPIADRGPHAAGILTMPIFLVKYGSRRARAHVLYNAFLCKDFVADSVKLAPSDEPDLTKRAGCSACHQTLEPMAAFFTRVAESDWTWLPSQLFPASGCAKAPSSGLCKQVYDPAFHMLRGAYASPAHVEEGPPGLAKDIVDAPEFAPCVVENVAQSLLGRQLEPEDDAWKTQLVKTFVDGGYRMRTLVRAIVTSPRYRAGNDVRR